MKNKSAAHLTIVLLLAVGVLGVYFALYSFLGKKVRTASENESRILLLQAKDEDVTAQKKLIEETKENIEILNNYFVYEEGVVGFLETLESLDAVTGTETEIATVNVKQGTEGKEKTTLFIILETEGRFSQVYHLLGLVEALPYEIDIEDISMSRTGKGEEGTLPVWRMSMSFSIVSFIPTAV